MSEWDCINDADVSTNRASFAPGDTVLLTPGNTYVPFTIPTMANGTPLTIRAKGLSFTAGTRVATGTTLPRIVIDDAHPHGPMMDGTGTVEWHGVEFLGDFADAPIVNPDCVVAGNFNTPATTEAGAPSNFKLSHCRMDGGDEYVLRGLGIFGVNNVSVHDSHFLRIKRAGYEPKAISVTSALGTVDIWNCWFDRCGMGVFTGESSSFGSLLAPRVTIEQCYFSWPTDWTAGGGKHHVEFKNWRHPRIVGCVFQNFWTVSAFGYVMNWSDYMRLHGFGRRAKGGVVAFNKYLNCGGGAMLSVTQQDGLVPLNGTGPVIMHNLWDGGLDPVDGDLPTAPWMIIGIPGTRIERNTCLADGDVNTYYYPITIQEGTQPARGLKVKHNILATDKGEAPGVFAYHSGVGAHTAGLDSGCGAGQWEVTGNVIGYDTFKTNGGEVAGQTWLASNEALRSALLEDYSIDPEGALAGMAVGADMALVNAATSGVVAGTVGPTRLKLDWALPGFGGA